MPTPGKPLDCLLVADDLTGACDAPVHFAATVLLVAGASAPAAPPPEEPRRALLALAGESPAGCAARVFKKIDSTLRGNTGLEIAAAMESFHCDAAVVCPAFPGMNRVVEGGFLR